MGTWTWSFKSTMLLLCPAGGCAVSLFSSWKLVRMNICTGKKHIASICASRDGERIIYTSASTVCEPGGDFVMRVCVWKTRQLSAHSHVCSINYLTRRRGEDFKHFLSTFELKYDLSLCSFPHSSWCTSYSWHVIVGPSFFSSMVQYVDYC